MAPLLDGFADALDAHLTHGSNSDPLPDGCCVGRVHRGAAACSCWRPVYDEPQNPPDTHHELSEIVATGNTREHERDRMCDDCAYRPNSPEKNYDPTYNGTPELLEFLAHIGDPFFCHDGIRRVIAWEHPAGHRIPAAPDRHADYRPPVIDGIPYQTTGKPGLLCAGWAARRRAVTPKNDT